MQPITFEAGPAALPQEVLQEASAAVLSYKGGVSLLSIPHRGKEFELILEEANALVHELLHLSPQQKVFWMQGGGRAQFALLPMNMLSENETAGYVDSGNWGYQAAKHAAFYGKVEIVGSTRNINYAELPKIDRHEDKSLQYLHITSNNTIYGTQFKAFPKTNVPLVSDMSSDILSRELPFQDFDLIYAVAQKNIGASGVTLVIANENFINYPKRELPEIFSYKAMATHNSLLNTPPVFSIYTCLLTLRWIKKNGGVAAMEKNNMHKAQLLYATLDNSNLFKAVVQNKADRSLMNVCFTIPESKEREADFLAFALKHGITGIRGHRSVGGFRASLYNAISLEDVQHLVTVMQDFERH